MAPSSPPHFNPQLALLRHQPDLLHQAADHIAHLQGILTRQRLGQPRHTVAVDLRQARMQARGRGDRRGNLTLQAQLALFQLLKTGVERNRRSPRQDRIDRAIDLAADTLQFLPLRCLGRRRLGLQPVPLAGELGRDHSKDFGVHQPPPKRRDGRFLKSVDANRQAVGAGGRALVARRRAAEVRGADLGKTTTAGPAGHQARKKMPRPLLGPEALPLAAAGTRWSRIEPGLPLLDRLPQCVIDNAELGHRLGHHGRGIILPRKTLSGGRVLEPAPSVPHQPASVELVIENAGPLGAVPVDGCRCPGASRRARNALRIEAQRDLSRRPTRRVFPEDPLDDCRLFRNDFAQAPFGLTIPTDRPAHGLVAKAKTAARAALPHAALEAAMGLLRQVLEEQCGHRALEANMQFRDLALRQGHHPHGSEAHLLVETSNVLLVSAYPIERLRDDDVEPAISCVTHEVLEARPGG